MQLEQEPPRQPNIALELRNIRAKMEIDIPKEISKKPGRNPKRSHSPQLLLALLVFDLLLNQCACLLTNKENHDGKGDFVHDDFVGPDVVDGDGDQAAEYVEGVFPALGLRGAETEELVQDGAYSQEHG